MKKVVIDTNIFISALIGSRVCNTIYEMFKENEILLIYSTELFNKLKDVLAEKEFGISKETIEKILRYIKKKGVLIDIVEKVSLCRDSKDNKILECALAGDVDFIITGDADLLEIKSFNNIPIVTPRNFIKKMS